MVAAKHHEKAAPHAPVAEAKKAHTPQPKQQKDAAYPQRKARPTTSNGGPSASAQPLVLHSSVVLGDLTADMKAIYHRTIRQMVPPAIQKSIPPPELIEEADGATMVFEVESKQVAEQMFKRLQNAHVYGSRWKVEYHPVEAVMPGTSEAAVVDVTLNPPGLSTDVVQALSSVQGFLAIDETTNGLSDPTDADAAGAMDGSGLDAEKGRHIGSEVLVQRLVAVFAEEGAAIHARAVLSGRQVGAHGSRMFLQLRHPKGLPLNPTTATNASSKKK